MVFAQPRNLQYLGEVLSAALCCILTKKCWVKFNVWNLRKEYNFVLGETNCVKLSFLIFDPFGKKNSGKSTPPCTSFMSLHGKHTEETLAVPAVTVLRCCICWNAWTGSQSSLWHRWGYREGPLWWNSLFVLTFETSGNDWLVGCRFCGYLQGLMQNS